MFCLKGKLSNTCQMNMKRYLLSICIMGRVTIHYFLKFPLLSSVVLLIPKIPWPAQHWAAWSPGSDPLEREGARYMSRSQLCGMFPCAPKWLGAPATLWTKASTPSRWEGAHEVGMSFIYCVSTAGSLGFLLSLESNMCTILIYLNYVPQRPLGSS